MRTTSAGNRSRAPELPLGRRRRRVWARRTSDRATARRPTLPPRRRRAAARTARESPADRRRRGRAAIARDAAGPARPEFPSAPAPPYAAGFASGDAGTVPRGNRFVGGTVSAVESRPAARESPPRLWDEPLLRVRMRTIVSAIGRLSARPVRPA